MIDLIKGTRRALELIKDTRRGRQFRVTLTSLQLKDFNCSQAEAPKGNFNKQGYNSSVPCIHSLLMQGSGKQDMFLHKVNPCTFGTVSKAMVAEA